MSFATPPLPGALGLEETRRAYAEHLVARGDYSGTWEALADRFAEDASYYDVFYGWMHGRRAIRDFLRRSMEGIEDWSFPTQWNVVVEGRVVVHWLNRLPGRRADGTFYEFPGASAITYGADGLIVQQMDLYDGLSAIKLVVESKLGGLGGAGARVMALSGAAARESARALYRIFARGQ
jgi:hypothetical protein